MLLYLVRHGEALSQAEDPHRGLSKEGHSNVQKIAGLFSPKQVSIEEIYHSKKLRAKQTASILSSAFAPSIPLQTLEELDPEATIQPVVERINTTSKNIMLVGHNPFMETLAAYLLSNQTKKPILQFSAGSIACLRRNSPSDWILYWALDPHMINY